MDPEKLFRDTGKKIGDIGKKGAQAAQKAVNMFKGDPPGLTLQHIYPLPLIYSKVTPLASCNPTIYLPSVPSIYVSAVPAL